MTAIHRIFVREIKLFIGKTKSIKNILIDLQKCISFVYLVHSKRTSGKRKDMSETKKDI